MPVLMPVAPAHVIESPSDLLPELVIFFNGPLPVSLPHDNDPETQNKLFWHEINLSDIPLHKNMKNVYLLCLIKKLLNKMLGVTFLLLLSIYIIYIFLAVIYIYCKIGDAYHYRESEKEIFIKCAIVTM
jgi:hypothetical protein